MLPSSTMTPSTIRKNANKRCIRALTSSHLGETESLAEGHDNHNQDKIQLCLPLQSGPSSGQFGANAIAYLRQPKLDQPHHVSALDPDAVDHDGNIEHQLR